LFGKIVNDEMVLNDAGKIANEYWLDIPNHFPNAVLHEHVVMPNHVHGIVELIPVGVRVENFQPQPPQQNKFQKIIPRSIGSIIKGFKIGVTKWFRNDLVVGVAGVGVENFQPLLRVENLQPRRQRKPSIWQRNFHEHIIRDEKSYQRISAYILNNPRNWKGDKFYYD
jgi:putative transposase